MRRAKGTVGVSIQELFSPCLATQGTTAINEKLIGEGAKKAVEWRLVIRKGFVGKSEIDK